MLTLWRPAVHQECRQAKRLRLDTETASCAFWLSGHETSHGKSMTHHIACHLQRRLCSCADSLVNLPGGFVRRNRGTDKDKNIEIPTRKRDIPNAYSNVRFTKKILEWKRTKDGAPLFLSKAPKVREAIKYLVKEHRYDYIETGSLFSIKKNTQGTVPTHRQRLPLSSYQRSGPQPELSSKEIRRLSFYLSSDTLLDLHHRLKEKISTVV